MADTDEGLRRILAGEVRAIFGTGVLSMQAASLIWGKQTTAHFGDWWKFLIATVVTLGIVAWSFRRNGKCVRHLLVAVAGLAVIWIAFSLVAFPLTYKAFVGVALVMIAWSLVWCACLVYAGCRSLPEQLRNFIEALDDGASIMLVYSLMGSIILAYGRFIDNNIRVWYVDAVMYVGCVVTLVMFLALVQKKRTSSAGSQQSAKS